MVLDPKVMPLEHSHALALNVLFDLQWRGYEGFCPSCYEFKTSTPTRGHEPTCPLYLALYK